MKKFFLFSFLIFIFTAPVFAFAQATISIASSLPGMGPVASTTPPGAFVGGFYQFALMIGGVLAFGAIVYGGILYAASAGNPGKQSEGREWITSALLGLLLLAGAYLILYTINPNLVNLNLPSLQTINITALNGGTVSQGGEVTGLNSAQETQSYAGGRLAQAGIGVVSTGNCSDPSNPSCTSLAGIRTDTVDEAVALKNDCGCTVTISGGTETGHETAQNGVDHADGYKIDLQANGGLTAFIETNSKSGFTQIANRTSDGAPQYVDPATGAVYAYEASKNHWDVTVP
jgi:hypothetical protein